MYLHVYIYKNENETRAPTNILLLLYLFYSMTVLLVEVPPSQIPKSNFLDRACDPRCAPLAACYNTRTAFLKTRNPENRTRTPPIDSRRTEPRGIFEST